MSVPGGSPPNPRPFSLAQLLSRVPGYRSGPGTKAGLASLLYLGCLVAILAGVATGVSAAAPWGQLAAGQPAAASPTSTPTPRAAEPTPTATAVPTPTATPTATPPPPSRTPTASAIPTPAPTVAARTPVPQAPAPPPKPPPATCGAPGNPWGYNFCGGGVIGSPPANFCDYFNCIPSLWRQTNGYVIQCGDGTFSHSGGVRGSCSSHGGDGRVLYQ